MKSIIFIVPKYGNISRGLVERENLGKYEPVIILKLSITSVLIPFQSQVPRTPAGPTRLSVRAPPSNGAMGGYQGLLGYSNSTLTWLNPSITSRRLRPVKRISLKRYSEGGSLLSCTLTNVHIRHIIDLLFPNQHVKTGKVYRCTNNMNTRNIKTYRADETRVLVESFASD